MFCCIIVFVIILIAAYSGVLDGARTRVMDLYTRAADFVAARDHFQLGYFDPNLYPSEIERNV